MESMTIGHIGAMVAAGLLISVVPRPQPVIEWTAQTSGVAARLRGLSAVTERIAWASGAGGTILRTVDGGATWQPRTIPGTAALDFRDIDAMSDRVAYALSIGPGASSRIYRTSDGGARWDLQFASQDPDLFLDAIAFWDADRGVAVGDSISGAFSILTTTDAGRTWTRVPPERLPPALPGEGAFAASGTNVAVMGHARAWIATGAGRILRSVDGGRSWTIASAPFDTGESSGIFSIAFRDSSHGVVVGGDYRKETDATRNAAVTADGGMTWNAPGRGLSGYRSVVASVPGTKGAYIAAGPSGIDWSSDDGRTWKPVPGAGFDTLSLLPNGKSGWAAGDRGRIARMVIRD
jgi:photosystem II stability/assembly factor-like uncharacterized protein